MKLDKIITAAACVFCLAFVSEAKADYAASLVTFTNGNGGAPYAGLTFGSDGNFYGVAASGGPNFAGTIFKFVSSNNVLTTLAFFATTNGSFPPNALTEGTNGNFYGVTYAGGQSNLGTVFEFVLSNQSIVRLVSFNGTNGANPWASLCLASDGNFYGTTAAGGVSYNGSFGSGYGTVFMLTHDGIFSNLYFFTNGSDGATPYGKLVQGTNGNLFGTTYNGGLDGRGTVFEMHPDPDFMPIVQFNGANGGNPSGGLIPGRDGYLYGTTTHGGTADNGTVFRMDYLGNVTVLHSFLENIYEGGVPYNGLFTCNGCDFYGTTYGGGASSFGTLFRLSVNRNTPPCFQTIYSFHNLVDGAYPESSLAGDTFGNIFGTTPTSKNASGNIFEVITPPDLRLRLMSPGTLNLRSRDAQPGITYQTLYAPTLAPAGWVNYGSSILATDRTINVTYTFTPGTSGFFRLALTPPGPIVP